jgi:hypothetical protein
VHDEGVAVLLEAYLADSAADRSRRAKPGSADG